MRVPVEWLLEYCDPGLDVAGIEERLTMTGTKVEAIHRHGVPATEGFVVGRVLTCEQHPDADRLRVCTVDVGAAAGEGPATIVCGAPNVAAGQTVAVALPGARMVDGTEIRRAKLRGVVSEGMICSERELAIGVGSEGILVLDGGAPGDEGALGDGTLDGELAPGTALAQAVAFATDVIELEITSNRPDCLGVYGVARELHAATGAPLAPAPWLSDPGTTGPVAGAEVRVECPDLCPRFTARVFEKVRVGPSPLWLKARLSAAGQRPIDNVVDITNYAMLLTGQPLHAFDLDRVAGGRLTVRRAHAGERVETLDGQQRTLDGEMVVIEDGEGPTSIAGVMGGERSEVAASTRRVLLEVASWNGPSIHRTSWALGLRSEASGRFEKGLAPEQCMWAQAVGTRLLAQLCGAQVSPGTIDVGGEPPPAPAIALRRRRVREILGVTIAPERQAEILRALDFEVAETGEGLRATPPPARRQDVSREADLIEEVSRIDGLERLPTTLPKRRGAYGVLSPEQRLRRRAADALAGRGLYETVGWTFSSPALAERLRLPADDPRRAAVELENPLSEEQSRLRTTLLGSLLEAASRNVAHGMSDLSLFEIGTVFALGDAPVEDPQRQTGVRERRALAAVLCGHAGDADWRATEEARRVDFYAVKGVLEGLAEALRVQLALAPRAQPFLHPGRAAAIRVYGDAPGSGGAAGRADGGAAG
ncbi:MAG TPA: phenylalanine--tRNA ligase subunit beta, partial [Solirubrobacteraceae bacterium]|nr:phenylalanine--tRNA ligase subunit beta [Solirubrobacteraceae bacterium]